MNRMKNTHRRSTFKHVLRHQVQVMPHSPNPLVELDIDPYPDDVVPIGLLASLTLSSLIKGYPRCGHRQDAQGKCDRG